MANTKTKSKFIYLYEHQSGDRSYDYNSLVDGVKPFDTEDAAKKGALDNIENHAEDVGGEFDPSEWAIHIFEVQSAVTHELVRAGVQLTSATKLF